MVELCPRTTIQYLPSSRQYTIAYSKRVIEIAEAAAHEERDQVPVVLRTGLNMPWVLLVSSWFLDSRIKTPVVAS